jgi:hypothetical protein
VERPAGVAGLPIALAGAEHDAVANLDAERHELARLVAGHGAMALPFFGFTFVLSGMGLFRLDVSEAMVHVAVWALIPWLSDRYPAALDGCNAPIAAIHATSGVP